MPINERLGTSHGAKSSTIPDIVHPSALIREKWPNTCQRERVEGLVPVGKCFQVVSRGGVLASLYYTLYLLKPGMNQQVYMNPLINYI